jgi:hypothetical protein
MPRGKPNSTIEERFIKRTYETPCPIEGMDHCWIWGGGEMLNGYGQLTAVTYGTRYAHQWACHQWNGSPLPIEKGMCVKHRCDVKLCVNPAHLEYGTLKENIQEMLERNPAAMGRIAPTEAELALLRQMLSENTGRKEMARRLGHARTWMDRIIRDYNLIAQ